MFTLPKYKFIGGFIKMALCQPSIDKIWGNVKDYILF